VEFREASDQALLAWRGNLGRASELPGIGWYDKVEQLIATRYAGL
jgi:hypothetical protein